MRGDPAEIRRPTRHHMLDHRRELARAGADIPGAGSVRRVVDGMGWRGDDETCLGESEGRIHMPGEGTAAAVVRQFGVWVAEKTRLPLVYVDERYSSAVISAKRGEVIDDRAAAIILQQYFDTH